MKKFLDEVGLRHYDGKIKEYVEAHSSAMQGDWNENDPTDSSYIKNRTHYLGEWISSDEVESAVDSQEYGAITEKVKNGELQQTSLVNIPSNDYVLANTTRDNLVFVDRGRYVLLLGNMEGIRVPYYLYLYDYEAMQEYYFTWVSINGSKLYPLCPKYWGNTLEPEPTEELPVILVYDLSGNNSYEHPYKLRINSEIFGDGPYTIKVYNYRELKRIDRMFLPDLEGKNGIVVNKENIAIGSQYDTGDVVMSDLSVMKWDDYASAKIGGEYFADNPPIGLVCDPKKRTFIYVERIPYRIYKSATSGLPFRTTFYDGRENKLLIEALAAHGSYRPLETYFPAYANGLNEGEWIPAVEEVHPYYEKLFYDTFYVGESFYSRYGHVGGSSDMNSIMYTKTSTSFENSNGYFVTIDGGYNIGEYYTETYCFKMGVY